jgi:hypothetical protein
MDELIIPNLSTMTIVTPDTGVVIEPASNGAIKGSVEYDETRYVISAVGQRLTIEQRDDLLSFLRSHVGERVKWMRLNEEYSALIVGWQDSPEEVPYWRVAVAMRGELV